MAITAISAGIEFLPETSVKIIRPEFGKWRCFFSDPMSTFVYLYFPIVLVQASNLVFFAMTANNLRETWNLTRDRSNIFFKNVLTLATFLAALYHHFLPLNERYTA